MERPNPTPEPVVKAIRRKFDQNSDGSTTIAAFRRRVHWDGIMGCYYISPWCGMFLGIEPDGYTHT